MIRGEDLAALLVGACSEDEVAARNGVSTAEVRASRATAVALLEHLQPPKRRRSWRPVVAALAAVGVLLVGSAAVAQVTCTALRPGLFAFCANQPALATEVNANFNQLYDWVVQKVGPVGTSGVSVGGGLAVTGATTVGGGLAVTGPTTLTGNAAISGNLDVGGAVLPDFDSGWVNAVGAVDTTLTHNLGVLPTHMAGWWRSGPGGFVNPLATYDEGGYMVNGPVMGVSSTQLKFRTGARAYSYFHYDAAGTYEESSLAPTAGQYRFLLWK